MRQQKRFFGITLTILLFSQSVFAGPPLAESVKKFIPTYFKGAKQTKDASRFKEIDDFTSRDFKNKSGGLWSERSSAGAQIEISYGDDEAVREHGFCLRVKYDFPDKGELYVNTDLNGLDVSKAKAVSFWLAFDAVKDAKVYVGFRDRQQKKQEVEISRRLKKASKDWQEVLIPLQEWKKINWNQLEEFHIRVEVPDKEFGVLLLDQMSFFGPPDVFYLSLRDNLIGAPKDKAGDRQQIRALPDSEFLSKIAADTWKYFANTVDKESGLPLNRIKVSRAKEVGDYVSPTDIGLYLMAIVCARELGLIEEKEVKRRAEKLFQTLRILPKWKGFLYNYYNTTSLQVTNRFVSTVDNGWLAAGLMVLAAREKALAASANSFLQGMDFGEFYDDGVGQFNVGYDDKAKKYTEYHYGMLITEARIASYVAIMKGDVSPEHWYRLYRVPPGEWNWQNQKPEGEEKEYRGITVFEGYYTYEGKKMVPSWGGSLFEFLMPTLVVKEKEIAVKGIGRNNRIAAENHRHYAVYRKRYPVWGISPCMRDRGTGSEYLELGIKELAIKGYPDKAIITPHASALALDTLPEEAIANLRRLLNLYPIYGEYGFYDSVMLRKPAVSKQYLALDQGMILVAVTNYLRDGIIKQLFHATAGAEEIESLLAEEVFFETET